MKVQKLLSFICGVFFLFASGASVGLPPTGASGGTPGSTQTGAGSATKEGGGPALTILGKSCFHGFSGKQTETKRYGFFKDANGPNPDLIVGHRVCDKNACGMFTVDASRIGFEARGKNANTEYGLRITLTGDMKSTRPIRDSYVFFEHPSLGALFVGNVKGVEDASAVGYVDIAPGTGGVDGFYYHFVNMTSGMWMGMVMRSDTAYATKIGYYTPRVAGLQLGVSFSPNTGHLGEQDLKTDASPFKERPLPLDKSNVCTGANCILQSGGLSLSLSAVGMWGKTFSPFNGFGFKYRDELQREKFAYLQFQNTRSCLFGAILGVGPVELSAEYVNNGRSQLPTTNMNGIVPRPYGTTGEAFPEKNYSFGSIKRDWSVNTGLVFTTGKTKIGVSYFYTVQDTGFVDPVRGGPCGRAIGKAWVFAAEHNIVTGLKLYSEIAYYKMKNPDWPYLGTYLGKACGDTPGMDYKPYMTPSNSANVFLIGMKTQF